MKSRGNKNKKLIILFTLLLGFILNIMVVSNVSNSNMINTITLNDNTDDTSLIENQYLSLDNTLDGIGAPWNITHWANRTDTDLIVSFAEGENDVVKFPLFTGWEGYKINADIKNLYDARNWNNGTFQYGNDDNSYGCPENDSSEISNIYQNWTFHDLDGPSYTNDMSGNYLDSSAPLSAGQDCLELRMDGSYHYSGGPRYRYDENDKCWWESSYLIPRGRVVDNLLKFQLNPVHLISFNSWELTISINNVRVYTIGIYTLKKMGINTWHDFSIPQGIWTNASNVFPSGYLNDTTISVEVALEYSANSASYGYEDGENTDYQQILFDNLELITTAEAYPSDLDLRLNNTVVSDENWGQGNVELNGEWQGVNNNLDLSFITNDVGQLGTYSVDLLTDVNLYALKDLPESNYETNTGSIGTNFAVTNNSLVEWSCYGRVNVPSKYEENLMRIEFPQDITITAVYDPQNPNLNILNQCDNSTAGILIIPINSISATPDGFWRFKAKSPNYCEELTVYSDAIGPWVEDYEFLSNDFINITAKIDNSPIITSYIQNTKAMLNIRFPNGTIWADYTQLSQVDSNGMVNFNVFRIPSNPPNYEVGLYEAIIMWNNSFSNFGFNETGFIYKEFRVIHESILTPEKNFYEDKYENSTINLKVSFHDLTTNAPIRNARLYTYDFINPGIEKYFSEISPGFYFLEFNLAGAGFGNNSITIYAESINYVNKQVIVVIEVIRKTNLNVDDDFLDNVQYNSNFTIQVDYIDNGTGLGVDPTEFYTNWGGEYYFSRISQGTYNLICNASGTVYSAGNLYSFNIYASAYQYESQVKMIQVFITELDSQIDLKLNDTPTEPNAVYIVEVWQQVNITIRYRDVFGNHIRGALVNIVGQSFTRTMNESLLYNQYTILLSATDLGQGIDNLIVTAEKENYKPNSLPFIFQITERQTNYNIFINGVNKTNDPFESVVVTSQLNITVRYYDITGAHIPDATVSLSGDYTGTLNEVGVLNQYTIIIDTDDLNIGIRLLHLSAYRANYESQTDVIRIQVQRIRTQINTTTGSPIIITSPGQSVTLRIVLTDLDFGMPIIGASINYSWAFGKGSLTDTGSDGIYETTLRNLIEGTYRIIISAYFGDNYDFKSYEITLTVIGSSEGILFFFIATIITISAGIALVGYLILYMRVLKYPKPVRKVRKYRRTLKSKKIPRTTIESRESAVKSTYENQTSDSRKFLKGKPSETQMSIDKMVKKNPTEESLKNAGGEME